MLQANKNNQLLLSYLIFFIFCFFIRAPYFSNLLIPRIDSDTFDYFQYSFQLHKGIFPDFSFIPPLYPLIYYIIEPLGTQSLIYLQIVFSILSYFLLLKELNKLNTSYLINTIFIILITSKSYLLRYETTFLTESIYNSLLVLFTVNIIQIYRTPHSSKLYVINSLLIFLIAFTRSNGMYLYLFPPLLSMYIYFYENSKRLLKTYVLTFVMLNIFWASFNYISYDRFFPGNTSRVLKVVKSIKNKILNNCSPLLEPVNNIEKSNSNLIYEYNLKDNWNMLEIRAKNINSKQQMIANYLYDFTEKQPRFYETILQERYLFWHNKFNGKNFLSSDTLGLLIGRNAYKDIEIRKYITGNYFIRFNKYYKSTLGVLIDKTTSVNHYLTNNFFFLFIFIFLYFINSLSLLRRKNILNKNKLLIFVISNIYLLNIIVVSFTHSRFVARYSLVCEFAAFLSIYLFLWTLFKNKKFPNFFINIK
jgi:hypothetical protein